MVDCDCYCCPLENTAYPDCRDCPFHTVEDGKHWCHMASKNFCYTGKACELGVFPIVYPSTIYRAELRYVVKDGVEVVQLNVADLEGTKETSQEPIKRIMAALAFDKLPKFRRRRKSV